LQDVCSDGGVNTTSAPYFLDALLDLPPAERRRAVASVLLRVWEVPSILLREIPPIQAITAVAVVAASLPGSAALGWVDDRLAAVALPDITVELVMRALSALDVVVGRDPESVHTYLLVSDGDAAQALLDDLRQVLVDSIRPA
jgi:hypothetical protein